MEILCDLGAQDLIVGIAKLKPNFPFFSLLKDRPVVDGGMQSVNLEQVLALHPDLVFCWSGAADALRAKGLRVFPMGTYDVEGVIGLVETIGRMAGRSREADRLSADMRRRLQRVETRISTARSRPKVYFEAHAMGKSRGPGCLSHDLITRAGGVNIAAGSRISFPQLSQEFILEQAPDVILVEEYGAVPTVIAARSGWGNVPAVSSGRIYVSPGYYTGYTPRCLDALEAYARWFHPEAFGTAPADLREGSPR